MKKYLPIIAAAVMGLVAVFLLWGYINKVKRKAEVEMKMVEVLVAQKEIREGEILEADRLAERSYPARYVGNRAVKPEDAASVIGSRAKYNLQVGRPILWSDIELRDQMQAGLAGRLGKGERAVTIPVSEITGVAGFLRPSDRVDVVYTFDTNLLSSGGGQEGDAPLSLDNPDDLKAYFMRDLLSKKKGGDATVTLLQNVLILATGSERQEAKGRRDEGRYSSVTLLLEERQAELIIYCLEQGKLSLVLRNAQYPETRPAPKVVTASFLRDFIEQELSQGNPQQGR